MTRIVVTKKDVIWNYAGTIASMASGFVLLPLLILYLDDAELGLWYVFLALSNLAQLFEFGFNPTFARNIVYCVSGARSLSEEGCNLEKVSDGIDFCLLKVVVTSSKRVYAFIAVVVLLLCLSLGSLYLYSITNAIGRAEYWVSWGLFCVAIFVNIYFLYTQSILRGLGDIAGENRSKFFSKIVYILICAITLMWGSGLIGASIGFLAGGIAMRVFASFEIRKHNDIRQGLSSVDKKVGRTETVDCVKTIWHIAWQDGLVQFANFAAIQSLSLICSYCFGVEEAGSFSVCLQLVNALYNLASVFTRSCFPMFQSAFAGGDLRTMRCAVSRGISSYLVLYTLGTLGIALIVIPLLSVLKPSFSLDYCMFFMLAIYAFLYNHHSLFCSFIVSMNHIPYRNAFVLASALGIVLTFVIVKIDIIGIYALILGQALPQLIFNNWRWPRFVLKELGMNYRSLLRQGFGYWKGKLV